MRDAQDSTLECSVSQIQGIDHFLVTQCRPDCLQPDNFLGFRRAPVERRTNACLGLRLVTGHASEIRRGHGTPHELAEIGWIVEDLAPVSVHVVLNPVDEGLLLGFA